MAVHAFDVREADKAVNPPFVGFLFDSAPKIYNRISVIVEAMFHYTARLDVDHGTVYRDVKPRDVDVPFAPHPSPKIK